MMGEVLEAPMKFRRRREISGREMWATQQPSDLMAWEICPYVKGKPKGIDEGCQGCPAVEHDELRGDYTRGCRVMAEEACRVMMAVQRRETIR